MPWYRVDVVPLLVCHGWVPTTTPPILAPKAKSPTNTHQPQHQKFKPPFHNHHQNTQDTHPTNKNIPNTPPQHLAHLPQLLPVLPCIVSGSKPESGRCRLQSGRRRLQSGRRRLQSSRRRVLAGRRWIPPF